MRAIGFALDGDGSGVAGFTQAFKYLFEVHEAGADQDLFAELVGVGGPAAILRVNGMNMRTEDGNGVDGIGLAVKDEVGGVEPDAEVWHLHVADGARHGGRGFLASLHQEALVVLRAVLGDLADGGDGLFVKRIGGILRDEAAMRLHLVHAEELGEIGCLLECIDARGAGSARHDTDGGWALHEVPHQGGGPTTSTVVQVTLYFASRPLNWSASCGVNLPI